MPTLLHRAHGTYCTRLPTCLPVSLPRPPRTSATRPRAWAHKTSSAPHPRQRTTPPSESACPSPLLTSQRSSAKLHSRPRAASSTPTIESVNSRRTRITTSTTSGTISGCRRSIGTRMPCGHLIQSSKQSSAPSPTLIGELPRRRTGDQSQDSGDARHGESVAVQRSAAGGQRATKCVQRNDTAGTRGG